MTIWTRRTMMAALGGGVAALATASARAQANRLWVQRNRQPVAPDRYGGTGLWLDRDAAGAGVVASVGTGSPAAAAGIMVGDRIVDPSGFEAVLRRIGGPRGTELVLGIDRGGTRMEKRLTPADYL